MNLEGVTFTRIPEPALPAPIPLPDPTPLVIEDAATEQALRWIGVPIPDGARKPLVLKDENGFPVEGVDPITFDEPAPALFSEPKPPTPPPAPPAPPAEPPPAPPTPPPAPPTPAPAPPAPTTPPPAPPTPPAAPDAEPKQGVMAQLGKAVEKLEGTLNKVLTPTPPPAPAAPAAPPVDPETALRMEALEHLENTGKYKGQPLRTQYQKYVEKYEDYRATWEKANPGKPFDEDDEDHEAFLNTHRPAIADEDIIRAEAVVETRREMQQELARSRVEQTRAQALAAGREAAAQVGNEILTTFQAKSVDELKAKDPALAFAVNEITPAATELVRTAHQLFTPGTATEFNESDQNHAFLLQALQKYDALLAKAPANESTLPDGRRFVPLSQWNSLPAQQRVNAWTLGLEPGVMATVVQREMTVRAQTRAEQIRGWFPAPAPTPPPAPAVPPPAAPPVPPPAAPPAPPPPLPTPPEGGAGAGAAPAGAAPAAKGSFMEYF